MPLIGTAGSQIVLNARPLDLHLVDPGLAYSPDDVPMQDAIFTPSPQTSPTRMRMNSQHSSSSGTVSRTPSSPQTEQITEIQLGNQVNEVRLCIPPVQQCPEIVGSNFIRQYDPANPEESLAGKRHRGKAEIEEQKENILSLKRVGGSCLWCLRTKKRCQADLLCKACKTHRRACYRGPEFFIRKNRLKHLNLPSPQAHQTLISMNAKAFENTRQFNVGINIFSQRACNPWTCTINFGDTLWHNHSGLNEPLLSLVEGIARSLAPDFLELKQIYGSNSLVGRVECMCKYFIASHWLVQANVLVLPADIPFGRTVAFFSLGYCIRAVFEMSGFFCEALYEAMRKGSPKAGADLDPTWVAVALYYKVVCGMRDIQDSQAVQNILGPNFSFNSVCASVQQMLLSWMPRQGAMNKAVKEQILQDEIPNLNPHIDGCMELWQDFRYHQLELQPPITMAEFLFDHPSGPPPAVLSPPLSCFLLEMNGGAEIAEVDEFEFANDDLCIEPSALLSEEDQLVFLSCSNFVSVN